jgi:predicted ATPase
VAALIEELIALTRQHGFRYVLAQGTIYGGATLVAQGQHAAGLGQIRQGLADYQTTGAEVLRPYYLTLLAAAYGETGQVAEGLGVLTEALGVMDHTGERWWEAEIHRLTGELLLQDSTRHKVLEAETSFRRALDVARQQSAKSLELRAAMSLSRLWQRQDKRDAAHELLAEVYGWFTEGFDTADLHEAQALLAEFG